MSYKKTMEDVKVLVQNELGMASGVYGYKFNSKHEAYAVILEEVEEAEDEFNGINYRLKNIWHEIKENIDCDTNLSLLERYAINLACEAIQVAAMARKAMR